MGAALCGLCGSSNESNGELNEYVADLVLSWTGQKEEQKILKALSGAPDESYNKVIEYCDVQRLVGAVQNHLEIFGGQKNREKLYDLFMKRHAALSVDARVKLVTALQERFQNTDDEYEIRLVEFLLTSISGEELSLVKDGLDSGGDLYDLPNLVDEVLTDKAARKRVVEHIQKEGLKLLKNRSFKRPIRLLSDIDDTLYQSGGGAGGPKFPRHTVFPGIIPFYHALSSRVTFVSARPQVLEEFTHRQLRENHGLQDSTVLTGRVRDLVLVLFDEEQANMNMGDQKLVNFRMYRELFREYKFVWLGDSGQGDALMGEQIVKEFGKDVAAVYIHDVSQSDGVTPKTPKEEREEWSQKGVNIVDTWVDAAVMACDSGLVSPSSLRTVAEDAVEQLKAVKFGDKRIQKVRYDELKRSLIVANEIFNRHGIKHVSPP